jgi:hypothetical protein
MTAGKKQVQVFDNPLVSANKHHWHHNVSNGRKFMIKNLFVFLISISILSVFNVSAAYCDTDDSKAANKEAENAEGQSLPQEEYKGEVNFPDSKDVSISFFVAKDLSKVNSIDFSAKQMTLFPTSPDSAISTSEMNDISLTLTNPIEIKDGRILNDQLLVLDLNIIDSCIYGNIITSADKY